MLPWDNRDYDVNLLIADKAWDQNGQLLFNPFNTDGFLGDQILVNWRYQPRLKVRARSYRFRILNGSVSRYFRFAVVREPNSYHELGVWKKYHRARQQSLNCI